MVGTSNMAGVASPTKELSKDLRKPNAEILVFQNVDWEPLPAGLSPHKTKGGRLRSIFWANHGRSI
jgi:hypothetical protein